MTDETTPAAPKDGLIRSDAAAEACGISRGLFEMGCTHGEIPVPLVSIGRFKYVRSRDLHAFLAPQGKACPPNVTVSDIQVTG